MVKKVNKQNVEELIMQATEKMRKKFSNLNLENMENNIKSLEVSIKNRIFLPTSYFPEGNVMVVKEDLTEYEFLEKDFKHMISHEFCHMATTTNPTAFLGTKSGFIKGYGRFTKNIAITEGMTDYLTEEIMGEKSQIAYIFEKKCARSLRMIFGDNFLQSFLDADLKSLYQKTETLGISKREINELFGDMDKSLIWRNECNCNLEDNKLPQKNNQYISNIEKRLINIAARVGLKRNDNKDNIANLIGDIQKEFVPVGLKFSIENKKEEEFLSSYSAGLEDAFLYARKMEDDIRAGRITSEEQIMPKKKSFFKRKQETMSLPSGPNEDRVNKSNQWKDSVRVEQNVDKNVIEINQENIQSDSKYKNHDDDLTI